MTLQLDASPPSPSITSALMAPGAVVALRALDAAIARAGALSRTLELVHVRASQIRGRDHGVGDAWPADVATWRDAAEFTPAERAALALTEAVSGRGDQENAARGDAWKNAARHFDPTALVALVLNVGHVDLRSRASA